MKPEECAEKLGITIETLFRRAYDQHGLMFGTQGPVADLAWYRRWGCAPLYVIKFVKREERRANAPIIDA